MNYRHYERSWKDFSLSLNILSMVSIYIFSPVLGLKTLFCQECSIYLKRECSIYLKRMNFDILQSIHVSQSLSPVSLCNPMDCSTPGFPVLHYLPEFAQTHIHSVSDAIQLSHPLLLPSLPALNLSQHQGVFQWISSSYQVAKVLELQQQSFQWTLKVYFLLDWLVGYPCSPRDSQESSPTPQFESSNS